MAKQTICNGGEGFGEIRSVIDKRMVETKFGLDQTRTDQCIMKKGCAFWLFMDRFCELH